MECGHGLPRLGSACTAWTRRQTSWPASSSPTAGMMGVIRLWPRHPHGRYGGHKAMAKTPTWQVWGSQGCSQDTHMAGMGVTRLWPRHPHGRYGGHKALAKTPTWQVWRSQGCGQDTHMAGMGVTKLWPRHPHVRYEGQKCGQDAKMAGMVITRVAKMPKWQVWWKKHGRQEVTMECSCPVISLHLTKYSYLMSNISGRSRDEYSGSAGRWEILHHPFHLHDGAGGRLHSQAGGANKKTTFVLL